MNYEIKAINPKKIVALQKDLKVPRAYESFNPALTLLLFRQN
jgi:hypothetical protein